MNFAIISFEFTFWSKVTHASVLPQDFGMQPFLLPKTYNGQFKKVSFICYSISLVSTNEIIYVIIRLRYQIFQSALYRLPNAIYTSQ